jgi:hypothetical protein
MYKRLIQKSVPITFCLIFFTIRLLATNFYVSATNGNNGNNGLTIVAPRQTIQSVVSLTAPGDTVFVMNGTYNSTYGPVLNLLPENSGSTGKYITYKAYLGHKPKITASGNVWNAVSINASYIVIDGFELEGNNANITYQQAFQSYQNYLNNIRDWAKIANFNTNGLSIGGPALDSKLPHHVTVKNCKIHDFPGGGLSSIQADYTTFENNLVYNNAWYMMYGGSGISILNPYDSDNTTIYRNIIRNNICHSNKTTIPWASQQKLSDGNGIILDVNVTGYSGGPTASQVGYKGRTLVENNLSINNGGSGIHTYKADHVDIVNNTAYHNGIVVGYPDIFTNNCNDVNIINNIMYSREGGQCNSKPKNATEVYDYNLYYNGTVGKMGTNDLVSDPQFVNLSLNLIDGDFRLKKGSPAIDSGTNTMKSAKDLDGRARPIGAVIDRGAYEFDPATFIGEFLAPEKLFRVYPSPASVQVSVVSKTGATIEKIELFDLSGRMHLSSFFGKKNEAVVDLKTLAEGIYLMRISGDNKSETMKIVKI